MLKSVLLATLYVMSRVRSLRIVTVRVCAAQQIHVDLLTGDGAPDIPAAVAVRPDFGGSDPLRIADCQRLHRRWCAARKPADAA